MSNLAVRVLAEPIRSLAAASVLAGYAAIGTALANPAHMFFVQNLTDASVMFSFDGVNDHFALPSNGFVLLDLSANKSATGGAFLLAQNTTFYVKRIGTPTTGSIYLSVFYGANG